MTRAAEAQAKNRSAWAEDVILDTVIEGFAPALRSDLLIEGLQKDERALLRVDQDIANRMMKRVEASGLTVTDWILFAVIGRLAADEKAQAA